MLWSVVSKLLNEDNNYLTLSNIYLIDIQPYKNINFSKFFLAFCYRVYIISGYIYFLCNIKQSTLD